VGLGRLDFPTPLVNTRVKSVVPNPSWAPGPTARREHAARGDPLPAVVPPGPDNPMGSMAIALEIPSYFIHGTNQPIAVGQTASLGCVRMYNEDVETLADMVRRDVPVRIVNEPYKIGWRDGELYAEVHPDVYGTAPADELQRRIEAAAGDQLATVNWALVQFLLDQPTGIAIPIQYPRDEPVVGQSIAQATGP
jgi:L,D-transpeptidase ErfK/SrfK